MEAVSGERAGAVAVVVVDNPPVNPGSLEVRRGLFQAVRAIAEDCGQGCFGQKAGAGWCRGLSQRMAPAT